MISQRTKGAPSSPSLPHQPEDPCLCRCRLRKTAVCAGVGMPSSSPRRCIRPESQGSSSRWDGYRIIARRENGVVHLWSRTGRNWAKDFPLIGAAMARLPMDVTLDGEAVCPLRRPVGGHFRDRRGIILIRSRTLEEAGHERSC
jgi:hypothetical protein